MEREQENQESESLTPPVETSTENPPVQQTPTNLSTNPDGRELYLAVLREKEQENARLRSQLEEKNKPVERPLTDEEEREFFNKPKSATQDLIRTELERQLAPLKSYVESLKQTSAYDQVKNKIRQNSFINNIFTSDIEAHVDSLMRGVEPTEANITAAILQVNGAKAAGLLPNTPVTGPVNNPPAPVINNQPLNQPPANPASMINPPHLRPSTPPAPKLENAPQKKPLTENERRLAREWGMTEDEYREGQQEGSLVLEPETTKTKKKEG